MSPAKRFRVGTVATRIAKSSHTEKSTSHTPVDIQAREWRESPRVSSVTHPPITSPRPGEATVTVGAAQRIGTTSSSGLLRPHSDCAVSQPEIMPRWGKRSSCRTRNSTTGRGRGILLARCGNSFTSTGSDDDVGAVPPDVVDHDLGVLRGGRTGGNQQFASSTNGCRPVGGRRLHPNCLQGQDVGEVDHSRILRRRRKWNGSVYFRAVVRHRWGVPPSSIRPSPVPTHRVDPASCEQPPAQQSGWLPTRTAPRWRPGWRRVPGCRGRSSPPDRRRPGRRARQP